VSLVVDDDASPPLQLNEQGGRGIEIRGMAEVSETTRPMASGFGADIIRIRPVRIDAWNLDDPGHRGRFVT
jgi:pyridoxamine 5'-phosphate oxidase family protein